MALVKEFEALDRVGLTDEEILKVVDGNWDMSGNDALCPNLIAKAQLKKVIQPITGAISVLFTNHPSECMRFLVQLRQALLDEVM